MAIRLGFFTGKIYTDKDDVPKECCAVLNYKEPVSDDEELVVLKRIQLKTHCDGCSGCEEAKEALYGPT